MVHVTWTDQAVDDLLSIRNFIALDSPRAAEVHVRRLVAATRRLKDFPFSGRILTSRPSLDVREIILGNYRIINRVAASEDRIDVLSVVHGARLINGF